jgi:hypothetical protein
MKALIRNGKHKNEVVEISQWCNDWFSINTGTKRDCRPLSPTMLAFTFKDLKEILTHKNNGTLLLEFKAEMKAGVTDKDGNYYNWIFKKKKKVYNL